jgi:hypothetical protein
MLAKIYILLLFINMLFVSSCIDRYFPEEIDKSPDTYVISGHIQNEEGFQHISVSKSSSISKIQFLPVNNCSITIVDSQDNIFQNNAPAQNGKYAIWIDPQFLYTGNAFKIIVQTPDNKIIESEFDTINPNPQFNEVYYVREDRPTSDPNVLEKGVQFKVDLIADNNYNRYFRWQIDETFEYRSAFPIQLFWYNGFQSYEYPDYSRFYCWKTNPVHAIYTVSTNGLSNNELKAYKLHFVNNESPRLQYIYCLKVSQFALSESYYNYLEKVRINTSEPGGLYETQPIAIKGNLICTSHPGTRVLGYFGAVSSQTKRFFFKNIENLSFDQSTCVPYEILPLVFQRMEPNEILYLIRMENGSLGSASESCFDCTFFGGTTEKPDYMPN